MSPSLKEIFDQRFPPETRDELAGLEDMTYQKLTLGDGAGPIQKGWVVTVKEVDLETDEHCVLLPSNVRRWFRNDEDIYAPLKR